jgi:hypothetical protein
MVLAWVVVVEEEEEVGVRVWEASVEDVRAKMRKWGGVSESEGGKRVWILEEESRTRAL